MTYTYQKGNEDAAVTGSYQKYPHAVQGNESIAATSLQLYDGTQTPFSPTRDLAPPFVFLGPICDALYDNIRGRHRSIEKGVRPIERRASSLSVCALSRVLTLSPLPFFPISCTIFPLHIFIEMAWRHPLTVLTPHYDARGAAWRSIHNIEFVSPSSPRA